MNQDKMDSDDDEILRDAFRNVRKIEVPPELKAKCLAAARDGMASAGSTRPVEVKHKRIQAFKLPAAIAASLLIGVSLGWVLRGNLHESGGNDHVRANPRPITIAPGSRANATSIVNNDDGGSEKSLFIAETYLCGVGRLQSRSDYRILGEEQ